MWCTLWRSRKIATSQGRQEGWQHQPWRAAEKDANTTHITHVIRTNVNTHFTVTHTAVDIGKGMCTCKHTHLNLPEEWEPSSAPHVWEGLRQLSYWLMSLYTIHHTWRRPYPATGSWACTQYTACVCKGSAMYVIGSSEASSPWRHKCTLDWLWHTIKIIHENDVGYDAISSNSQFTTSMGLLMQP